MALHVNIFAALTDHFADPFVRENVARVFDINVMTFESLTLTPFCMEILLCKKMDISMF